MQIKHRIRLSALVMLLIAGANESAIAGQEKWVRIIDIGNFLCLSSSYRNAIAPAYSTCGDRSGWLTRAKRSEYTHVHGYLPWDVPTTTGGWPTIQEQQWADYFVEALLVADSLGLRPFPEIVTTGRTGDQPDIQMFGYFQSLHKESCLNRYLSGYNTKGAPEYSTSSPTVPDANFDAEFDKFLTVVASNFLKASVKFKNTPKDSLDFFGVGFDEFGGVGDSFFLGYSPTIKKPSINIGITSQSDRLFIESAGLPVDLAFKKAIARGLLLRTQQVKAKFPRVKKVVAFGEMFDPQDLGGVSNVTYKPNQEVILSPESAGSIGVLDLPGLSKSDSLYVKKHLALIQWHYVTFSQSQGNFHDVKFPVRYHPLKALNYLTSKGFDVISWESPVYVDPPKVECQDLEPSFESVENFKETIDAGKMIKSKFLGFALSWYPADANCEAQYSGYKYPYWMPEKGQYEQFSMFNYMEIGRKFYNSP